MVQFDVSYVLNFLQRVSGQEQDEIARQLEIGRDRLQEFMSGIATPSSEEEDRIYHLALKNHLHRLLAGYAMPAPNYDYNLDFFENLRGGPLLPLGHSPAPRSPLGMQGRNLLGQGVRMPFGISASPLTANSQWLGFYAQKGFDVLTYKTVRSSFYKGNNPPHWGFVQKVPSGVTEAARENVKSPLVTATQEFRPRNVHDFSMVNSFGIPSLKPEEWQEDVNLALENLDEGQILIVSITGTWDLQIKDKDLADAALVDDFRNVARLVYIATGGQSPIELDLSCPNVDGGMLFRDMQDLSKRICKAVRDEVPESRIIAKIGYLPVDSLYGLVDQIGGVVDGITAINAFSVPVMDEVGEPFFVDRSGGGLSGSGIRGLAREVVSNLVNARRDGIHDAAIIAVGGIMSSEDVRFYLDELGVDAVQVCTAALINPNLALEVRDAYDLAGSLTR